MYQSAIIDRNERLTRVSRAEDGKSFSDRNGTLAPALPSARTPSLRSITHRCLLSMSSPNRNSTSEVCQLPGGETRFPRGGRRGPAGGKRHQLSAGPKLIYEVRVRWILGSSAFRLGSLPLTKRVFGSKGCHIVGTLEYVCLGAKLNESLADRPVDLEQPPDGPKRTH